MRLLKWLLAIGKPKQRESEAVRLMRIKLNEKIMSDLLGTAEEASIRQAGDASCKTAND